MYQIDVDKESNLISIEMTGRISLDEVKLYIRDFEEKLTQFGKKEALILMMSERMDPVSQESALLLIQSLIKTSSYIKRVSTVHHRVVTSMQLERIAATVKENIIGELDIKSFRTKKEALEYLKE